MSLSDDVTRIENEILAEGKRIRALAMEEALKLRKSKLYEEIQAIEAELAKLLGAPKAVEEACSNPAEPEPAVEAPEVPEAEDYPEPVEVAPEPAEDPANSEVDEAPEEAEEPKS